MALDRERALSVVHPWCREAWESGVRDPDDYPCDECWQILAPERLRIRTRS